MIGCEDARFYLEDFMDGDLIDEGMREMQVHLHECAECAKELQLLEKTNAALVYESEYRVPDSFVDECMGKIGKLPAPSLRGGAAPRYGKTVAAFAAAAGIAGLTLTAGLLFRKSAVKLKKAS